MDWGCELYDDVDMQRERSLKNVNGKGKSQSARQKKVGQTTTVRRDKIER